jgi:hypothetical protein
MNSVLTLTAPGAAARTTSVGSGGAGAVALEDFSSLMMNASHCRLAPAERLGLKVQFQRAKNLKCSF